MRNKVHKFCVVLTLALLPVAAGCTVAHVVPTDSGYNPVPSLNPQREPLIRKHAANVLPTYWDLHGCPYPDLRSHPINHARLAGCHYSIQEYMAAEGGYEEEAILGDLARRVNGMCADGRTLIILIHGFNASFPEISRSYKVCRLELEHAYPGRKFAYLEFYWDAMYGSPLAIWPEAQNNSKWAGLGLRKLLCRLDPALPVRVLTHSRGASVICSALWNTELRSTVAADAQYRKAQESLSPPVLPNIRIGLLAPAMRAIDFDRYYDRGNASFCYHDRIVLGLNPDDAALKSGGMAWLVGTTLGCTPEDFDSVVSPLLNRGRAHAFAVDFSGSVEHGFEDYVLRDVFEEEFLPQLFRDDESLIVVSDRK